MKSSTIGTNNVFLNSCVLFSRHCNRMYVSNFVYGQSLSNFPVLPYYLPTKQVFFRAGVLGQMEELRDERLGKIVTWMQSWIRGYLSRKEFKKLQEQRLALQVCQRNLRKYLKLRTWPWYKLWQKVKPLLNVTRIEDEIAVSRIYTKR